ncbi:MAG: hypothetical protein L6R37_006633 [Teloschistes peruensis]|nr:MAG: hypothetical protein L6R37_006633 [Teloschistes peruensis]
MLPMVQTLPGDRMIHVEIPVGKDISSGGSALVVWAHHALGLTVLVRLHGERGRSETYERFGNAAVDQLSVEEVEADGVVASITLLDTQEEILLKLISESDGEEGLTSSVRRIPARGYGNFASENRIRPFLPLRTETRAIIEILQDPTSAFAIIVARNLVKAETEQSIDEDNRNRTNATNYYVNEHRLIQASRFLFDVENLNRQRIEGFVAQYSADPLNYGTLARLTALDSAAGAQHQTPSFDDYWGLLCYYATALSIFLMAFAHVTNLEDCGNLKSVDVGLVSIPTLALTRQLADWDGRDALRIPDDAWLQALAVPLVGYEAHVRRALPWERICLISDRGWSAWISTLAQHNPENTNADTITLRRGSPRRNGVWKTAIWDLSDAVRSPAWTSPETVGSSGQFAHLRCAKKSTLDKPYCGEGEDAFIVCARLRCN